MTPVKCAICGHPLALTSSRFAAICTECRGRVFPDWQQEQAIEEQLHAELGASFGRMLADAGAPVVRAMATWCGLLELPDPRLCPVCGQRMLDVCRWNELYPIGYVCDEDHELAGAS